MTKKNQLDLEKMKESLIETAKKILKQEGRSGLHARRLTEKAGCSVGTLYNVFKNMEDLVFHVNANTLDGLQEFLLSRIATAGSRKQLARMIGASYLEYGRKNSQLWHLLFAYQANKDERIPYWYQQKIKGFFQTVEKVLEGLLQQLDRRKLRRAARTLWAGLHGITLLELNGKLASSGAESPILLWDSLFQNYITGMQIPKKRGR